MVMPSDHVNCHVVRAKPVSIRVLRSQCCTLSVAVLTILCNFFCDEGSCRCRCLACFKMEGQRPKRNIPHTHVRDLVLKMFTYFKWKQTTVTQCRNLPSYTSETCDVGLTTVQRTVSEGNWKWDKSTVINNVKVITVVDNY